jgi:hypothetical protein
MKEEIMDGLKKMSFGFEGTAGQSKVKTERAPGLITKVFLTYQKYTGPGNKTVRWDPVGSYLQVRCTFWGFAGHSTAAVGFNVFYLGIEEEALPAAAAEENMQQLAIEISGSPGAAVEKSYDDLGGVVKGIEFLGQKSGAATTVELEPLGERGLRFKGELDSTASGTVEDTIFVQVITTPDS